jgi:hypothetical protein
VGVLDRPPAAAQGGGTEHADLDRAGRHRGERVEQRPGPALEHPGRLRAVGQAAQGGPGRGPEVLDDDVGVVAPTGDGGGR